MLRLIILLAFVANLNYVLTDTSPSAASSNDVIETESSAVSCSENSNSKIRRNCGPNQVFEVCPSTCPPRTCKTKDIAFRCAAPLKPGDPKCPPPGCRCADGYYSNDEGRCVKKEQCPVYNVTCGTNEIYVPCSSFCDDQRCENIDQHVQCREVSAGHRRKGECRCRPGFYKNKINQCISAEDCKKCQGPHEYFACDNACDNECSMLSIQSHANCPIMSYVCNKMCYCEEGYARDSNNICIPISKCPSKCKANEEYSDCPNKVCREKTCGDLGFQLPCYTAKDNSTECGRPGCICKKGYVKNKNGVCIQKKNCPSCGGDPNAMSGCGTFCNRCTKNGPCPRICRVNGCDCRPGYVYDETKKKCVLPTQCPKVCKENEEYEECPNRVCREKKCTDLGYPLACLQSNTQNINCGQPDCICKAGFVRNKDGKCIPSRECPSCGGDPNAWSGCGIFCTRCSNYKNKNQACILLCRLNGCDCRDGYIYDGIKKKCVLPEQCPCGPNEVRSNCANSPCVIENCSQKDQNHTCKPNPATCKPGCLCAKGYLRAENGTCIAKDQCPTTCGPNQVYSDCANAGCDKRNCSQVAEPTLCIDVSKDGCVGGCVCELGYLRNAAGKCVPVSDCPSKEICPKPHEYYDQCPPSCPARQCNIDDRLIDCRTPSPTDKCIPSCRCEEGYYRNLMGDCVTFEECPKCGPLEVYNECANAGCDKRNCSQVNQPDICIDVIQGGCIGGCVCQPDYLHNAAGVCVRPLDCPSKEVCPKPHEYFDQCPPSCPARQCGIDDRAVLCKPPSPTAGCNKPSCRCEEGYYRNPFGDCVTFEECPKCSENEVYDTCPSSCPPRTCETKDRVYKCKAPLQPGDPKCPRPTCRCADNYYKNSDGKCVSKEECPPQCGLNEVASDCATNICLPDCTEPTRNLYCKPNPANCKPGCVCAEGYLRDPNGVCVAKDKCPTTLQCGANEVVFDCANDPCIRNCATKDFNLACESCPSRCKTGCVCADGYLRDKDGVCIPIKKCPFNRDAINQ